MTRGRPNVLLILTDQHRGDCIGADPRCPRDRHGDPLVRTPNLDGIAADGALFSSAYTPAPKCIPARKCLWSGQAAASAGATMDYNHEWAFENSLPRVLRDAGYQTMLAGKLHSQPPGNRIGFEEVALHTASRTVVAEGRDDYANWLDRRTGGVSDERGHGLDFGGGADARPWHLQERLHPTNWTTERAIEFVEHRDPTRPFFLVASYVRPHTPFDPPRAYWDQYIDRDLPEPAGSDTGLGESVRRARAAYYGLITHVDHQISRLLDHADTDDLLVMMTSDHGEMLGDHGRWHKRSPYEGSARVPMLLGFPDAWDRDPVGVIDRPVGLEDVMPTVLDAAGIDVPGTVEGRSLRDLVLDPDRGDWRSAYHGEWGPHYSDTNASQYLADGSTKYVWNPVTGEESLFDLDADPLEETNLAGDPAHGDELSAWRSRLADRLEGRTEGFVEDGELRTVEPEAWDRRYE